MFQEYAFIVFDSQQRRLRVTVPERRIPKGLASITMMLLTFDARETRSRVEALDVPCSFNEDIHRTILSLGFIENLDVVELVHREVP